jgi:hypothetical protein
MLLLLSFECRRLRLPGAPELEVVDRTPFPRIDEGDLGGRPVGLISGEGESTSSELVDASNGQFKLLVLLKGDIATLWELASVLF